MNRRSVIQQLLVAGRRELLCLRRFGREPNYTGASGCEREEWGRLLCVRADRWQLRVLDNGLIPVLTGRGSQQGRANESLAVGGKSHLGSAYWR